VSKTKNLYKVYFLNDKKEVTHLYASQVSPTSFLGLIEVSDIVFIDSSELIVTPEDDKIRKEFQDVVKTYIPIGYILRIDEITLKRETPVIRLYKANETE
jgi:hypothetical protein